MHKLQHYTKLLTANALVFVSMDALEGRGLFPTPRLKIATKGLLEGI